MVYQPSIYQWEQPLFPRIAWVNRLLNILDCWRASKRPALLVTFAYQGDIQPAVHLIDQKREAAIEELRVAESALATARYLARMGYVTAGVIEAVAA